jgi:type III secretion protein C
MSACATEAIFAVGLVLAVGAAPKVARAASPDWRQMPYHYVVVNQGVVDVLTNFGYNTGLRMSIASDVTGVVRGRIDANTAGSFLDAVTRSNALDWYYDGSVMYVSPAADEQTVTVPLHGASFEAIKASLARSGLTDKRYGLSHRASADFVIVSGPPSYVSAIKQAIEVEAQERDNTIAIFRGSQSASVKFP